MDKKIKKLISKTKNLEKSEKSLLKEDIRHDRVIDKAKKVVKSSSSPTKKRK